MQLTINILDNSKSDLMMEILAAINKCKCIVLEIRCSQFTGTKAGYLLIGGNWNHIAKLENSLETLNKQTDVKITKFRIDEDNSKKDLLPYALETISLNKKNTLLQINTFLMKRNIQIQEISGSCYQTPYLQTEVFSTKFLILIPPDIGLLTLREELLDFCDQLNIDTILEPVKR